MSPDPNRAPNILAVFSTLFAVAAFVFAYIFAVTPKGGIAVVALFSFMGGCALSAIGLVLGLRGLTIALGRKGRWRLAAFGVLANAVLLVYFLGNYYG